jgi:peptide/nickel transport system substrate-binding protein
MIVMNSASGATADPRIRKAVAAAIDPVAIDKRVNDSTGLPTSALIHPQAKLNPGVDGPKYDPTEAKRLVAAVKGEGKWDGTIKLITYNIPRNVDTAITIQGMLEAVGFKVNYETPQPTNEIVRRVTTTKDFELSMWGLAISDVNPWGGLSQLISTSPTSYFGYKNPAFDAAVGQLQKAPDVAAKKAALGALQTAWTADPPVAVLAAEEEFIAYGKRVHGLMLSTDYFLFDKAYVK